MNGVGRIFGIGKARQGQQGLSASGENRKADLLQQVANIRAIGPLFARRNGTGIEIGIAYPPGSNEVAYPCRVVDALLNNEAMTSAQREAPQEPARITYTVKADARATGEIPPGVDFTIPLPVRYGRPFGTSAKVLAAAPNDLCFVSSFNGVVELWIISERIATLACVPTAPPPAPEPAPTPLADPNSSVGFQAASGGEPQSQTSVPDPQMATHVVGENLTLDASVQDGITPSFYVGDADYVTLTGNMQLSTIKAGWLRDLLVEWSPDGRVWQKGSMIDPIAKTYASAKISADGFVQLDVREGIAYVRARWDTGGTLAAAGTLVELRWSKKRGTRS